jgi:hypothetical protein
MGFILAGFFALAVLTGAIWLAMYLATRRGETARLTKEERDADVERRLRTPGEPLYCMACQVGFYGPLTEEGCPTCHCAGFVSPIHANEAATVAAAASALAAGGAGSAATTADAEPRTVPLGRSRAGSADSYDE